MFYFLGSCGSVKTGVKIIEKGRGSVKIGAEIIEKGRGSVKAGLKLLEKVVAQ